MSVTHLKKVQVSLLLCEKINQKTAKTFIKFLAKALDMQIVFLKAFSLPSRFDVLAIVKESHIYLGYWPEVNLVQLEVFSCKNFEEDKIHAIARGFFLIEAMKIEVIKDKSVFEEIKDLCPTTP